MTEQPEMNPSPSNPEEEIKGVVVEKVEGKDVKIMDSVVGSVSAQASITVSDSFAGALGAGQNISVNNGGAIAIGAGANIDVTNGGAFSLSAGKDMHIHNGGGNILSCQQAVVENSSIGLLITNEAKLGEGVKVLMTRTQAIAFGAAFGATVAMISYLLRRRR